MVSACSFERLSLVNFDTNLNMVSMFIKLSHDGFPEITHFPDSVLKASCRSFVLLFGKCEGMSSPVSSYTNQ